MQSKARQGESTLRQCTWCRSDALLWQHEEHVMMDCLSLHCVFSIVNYKLSPNNWQCCIYVWELQRTKSSCTAENDEADLSSSYEHSFCMYVTRWYAKYTNTILYSIHHHSGSVPKERKKERKKDHPGLSFPPEPQQFQTSSPNLLWVKVNNKDLQPVRSHQKGNHNHSFFDRHDPRGVHRYKLHPIHSAPPPPFPAFSHQWSVATHTQHTPPPPIIIIIITLPNCH